MPSRQLFRGLFFCFYPQPSLFKINGVKANAAKHFGAIIEQTPSRQTTHILVARESAQSRPFIKFLAGAALDSSCAIVDNDWCSQCIDSGKLLNTAPFAIDIPDESPKNGAAAPAVNPVVAAPASSLRPSSPPGSNAANFLSPLPLSPSKLSETAGLPVSKRLSTPPRPGMESPSKRARPARARREDAVPSTVESFTRSPSPLLAGQESRLPHASPSMLPRDSEPPSPSCSQSPSPNADKSPVSQRVVIPEGLLRASRSAPSPRPTSPLRAASQPLDSDAPHPNQALIDVFNDFMVARQATGDEFSARAYERALKALQETSSPVRSYDDAVKLPNFTQRMARLVDDVQNDALPRALKGPMKEMTNTLALFTTVYGVGPAIARALYDQGCRSLEDIKPFIDDNGRYSIVHHADFLERMSRSEVDVHYQKVKDLVARLDDSVQSYCMGSYRRGEETCGDIDVVLTREGASIAQMKKVLKLLLDEMFACGFADHTFSAGSTRWLGATQVNGKMRRMDILLVPWQELGAAMIYYTGNNNFNRQIRLSALKQSMRLNEKGLYRVYDGGTRELVEGHDERRIFELLGWTWRDPHERRI